MTSVDALHLKPSRRHDIRSANFQSTYLSVAPMAIDCVGKGRARRQQYR